MNFILSWFWFFLFNELRSDTDCTMRLGKLMNWRQCDRVFIGGLGLRLFNCDRLSVSPPASPLPDRAVHTRAQSTYLLSSFFRCFFYFFPSLVLSFFTHAKKKARRRWPGIGFDRTPFAVSLILIDKIVFLFFFFTTLYVHWIIEEEIKHSAGCFWCALSSQVAVNSIRSFIHLWEKDSRAQQTKASHRRKLISLSGPIVLRARLPTTIA